MIRASAGGVVVGRDGKLVLVEQHGNTWSLPKGGIEAGETPLQAAVREIKEETGLVDLVYIQELGTYERYSIGKDGVSELEELGLRPRTFFLFTTGAQTLVPQDGEVTNARWVTYTEALSLLTHPKDKDFLKSSYATMYAVLHEVAITLH